MRFNYTKEWKKFQATWEKTRMKYLSAGMSESAIEQIYQFDLAVFRSDRNYIKHTQPLPTEISADGLKMIRKFDDLSFTIDESLFSGDNAWIETIDSPLFLQRVRSLSSDDLEILTLYALEGFNQREIAQMRGCHQSVISRKIKKIKKILRG